MLHYTTSPFKPSTRLPLFNYALRLSSFSATFKVSDASRHYFFSFDFDATPLNTRRLMIFHHPLRQRRLLSLRLIFATTASISCYAGRRL